MNLAEVYEQQLSLQCLTGKELVFKIDNAGLSHLTIEIRQANGYLIERDQNIEALMYHINSYLKTVCIGSAFMPAIHDRWACTSLLAILVKNHSDIFREELNQQVERYISWHNKSLSSKQTHKKE